MQTHSQLLPIYLYFFFCFFCTRRHFSSWLDAHKFILTRIFSTLPPWRGNCSIFSDTPPLATLLRDALLFHSVFRSLQCLFFSYPSCAWFLLDLSSECLLHYVTKCTPYPMPSLCIHLLHTVNPILLPVHDRTRNLGSCIFPGCDACTFPSYRVSCLHIMANISLSCLPRLILLQHKV